MSLPGVPVRILQVVHQFLPDYIGGTEVYVAGLSKALRQRGHDVLVFAGGDTATDYEWDGTPVTQVVGGTAGPRGPLATFMSTFRNPATEDAFLNALSDFQPDLVHFQHLLGLSGNLIALAKSRRLPTCLTIHDYWFMCPKTQLIDHRGNPCSGPSGAGCALCAADRMGGLHFTVATMPLSLVFRRRIRVVRQIFSQADVLLAPSAFLSDLAKAHGLPADRIRQVDFGTELSVGLHMPRPEGSPLRVTYLGSIEESKGAHVLVEAVRTLPTGSVRVDIAGSLTNYPDYASRLLRQGKGLPVNFRGALRREQVATLLTETDVLVTPSLWYENSPMVVAEAFAAGVPVVASRIGALAEKVQDGVNGLLFPPGDVQALAAALLRLVDEPDLLQHLRDGTAGGPSRAAHVQEMEQLYEELAARSPRGVRR